MKLIKIIGHPVALISIFLLLIIEGDNFGGFYLLYLVLALPHGVPYALIAALGIALIVLGFNTGKQKLFSYKILFYFIGFCLMIVSLLIFFAKGNKWATFELTVPLLTFVLFGVCSICFLISTFSLLTNKNGERSLRMIS